jgi:hypothetical protein
VERALLVGSFQQDVGVDQERVSRRSFLWNRPAPRPRR